MCACIHVYNLRKLYKHMLKHLFGFNVNSTTALSFQGLE